MNFELPFINACAKCGKVKSTVRDREIRPKGYRGPCGDSFCANSCDMVGICTPIQGRICDGCATKMSGKSKREK